jgi:adenylosuccinate lyase
VERLIFPDGCLALDYILRIFTHVVRDMDVDEARMRANMERTGGLIYSGRVLLALVDKGIARNDAYSLVQSYAKRAWAGEATLKEMLASDAVVCGLLSGVQLDELFDEAYHLRYVDVAYRRLGISR